MSSHSSSTNSGKAWNGFQILNVLCDFNGGGAPCPNRGCASEKKLESCLSCDDYLTCKNTAYHREWYPFGVENYRRVKEVGFEKYIEEEEERARAGVDLMSHLQRGCCKVVKLQDK